LALGNTDWSGIFEKATRRKIEKSNNHGYDCAKNHVLMTNISVEKLPDHDTELAGSRFHSTRN